MQTILKNWPVMQNNLQEKQNNYKETLTTTKI